MPEHATVNESFAKHSDYEYRLTDWTMIRDFLEGERKVKERTTEYLPRLEGQKDSEYRAYLLRTKFFPGVFRTEEALLGLLFRQDPVNRLTPRLNEWSDNVDRRGTSLPIFQKKVAKELISIGRGGVLVDVMPGDDNPHLVKYQAEHIINWQTDRCELVRVDLKESKDQFRILTLEDGIYWHRVWRSEEGTGALNLVSETTPLRRGGTLNFIPFFPLGWRDNDIEIDKPPLLDLTWLNLHHYQANAIYSNGSWYVGVPQPYVTGYQPPATEEGQNPPTMFVALGTGELPFLTDPEARMRYLEHNGTGLSELRESLQDIKDEMATIGVRMLAQERLPQETATSARIHRMSEIAVLTGISRNLSEAFRRILDVVSWWVGDTPGNEVRLGTEFFPVQHSADDLLKYSQLWRQGDITDDEWHRILIESDVRSADKTVDEALAEVRAGEGQRQTEAGQQAEPGMNDNE